MTDSGQSAAVKLRGGSVYIGQREGPVLERLLQAALEERAYQLYGDRATLEWFLQKVIAR